MSRKQIGSRVVLVLDKLAYRENASIYKAILKERYEDAAIVYTEYEDGLIRRVRNCPGLGSLLQHILYWLKSFGYALRIRKIRTEAIICINPIVGFFLGLMNPKQTAEITLCGFLFEPKKNPLYYKLRKALVRQSLAGIQHVVVYAEQEVDYYRKQFPGIHSFIYVPYGIDYLVEERYPDPLPERYIFSGGGSNRDYQTLVEAYNALREKEELPALCIATNPGCVAGLKLQHVRLLTDVVLENFGDVMKRSEFMVLSLKDTELSAGHQVLLEALKNNVLVMVNRIPAICDYVSEQQVMFYESGNVQDLQDKIQDILCNYGERKAQYGNNRAYYEASYTFEALLRRLVEIA